MKKVTIHSDGACSGNPGPGGYGVILECGGRLRELSGGYKRTTNNRMELTGVIAGLAALKEKCDVTVVTDSRYVVDAMSLGWAKKWRANNWRRGKDGVAMNSDLWAKLLDLCEGHEVRFQWIRGHNGHPMNERCDRLAVAAVHGGQLADDRA